jgi:hypothetical protein
MIFSVTATCAKTKAEPSIRSDISTKGWIFIDFLAQNLNLENPTGEKLVAK